MPLAQIAQATGTLMAMIAKGLMVISQLSHLTSTLRAERAQPLSLQLRGPWRPSHNATELLDDIVILLMLKVLHELAVGDDLILNVTLRRAKEGALMLWALAQLAFAAIKGLALQSGAAALTLLQLIK